MSTPLALTPHPQCVAPPFSITVTLHTTATGALALRYRLEGALDALLVPQPCTPGPADGLWQHTCFEAFVAASGEDAYREFNFSPSGQWAAYAFRSYRERDDAAGLAMPPELSFIRRDRCLELLAQIPSAALPPTVEKKLEIGLTAVVETTGGSLSYWALRHPAPKPDFHHRGGFLLEFAPTLPEGQS